jgi:hypothetical protein
MFYRIKDRVVAYPRIGSGLGLKSLLKPKTVLRISPEDGFGWLQLIQNLYQFSWGIKPSKSGSRPVKAA